jgi:lysophospholipase L1-like esterase
VTDGLRSRESPAGLAGNRGSRNTDPCSVATKLRRRMTSRRRWLFRFVAVLGSFACLGVFELLLVACGSGEDLSIVRPVPHACEILKREINANADRAWCPGSGMAGPESRRIDIPAAENVFRIVVVGASTVQGFPYASELAFPRQLEVLLNLQQSRYNVEVLNLGITGISSTVVSEILADSLVLEPDLIIVHAGHNEFYGVGGTASTINASSRPLLLAAAALRRTRIGQFVSQLLPSGVPDDRDPIEFLPMDLDIERESDSFAAAEAAYRSNLKAMVTTARDAGVPIILTTVAANHRTHSPVNGFIPTGLTDSQLSQWRVAFDEGRRLTSMNEYGKALDVFGKATSFSEQSSLLQYRRAECLLALGRTQDADEAFELAADLDGCRFRAPSTFKRIVSEVAVGSRDQHVVFIDTEQTIRNAVGMTDGTTDSLPIFLEHVHYSLHGHAVLAEVLGRQVLKRFLSQPWNDSISPASKDFHDALGVLPEDDLVALSFALEVYRREPMSRAFDAQRHCQRLISEISRRFGQLAPAAQNEFSALSLEDMANDLPGRLGDQISLAGDQQRLLAILRTAVVRRPWSVSHRNRLVQQLRNLEGGASEISAEAQAHVDMCRRLGVIVTEP